MDIKPGTYRHKETRQLFIVLNVRLDCVVIGRFALENFVHNYSKFIFNQDFEEV